MESVGVYCATVITAITSQNTMGITGVMPVGGSVVESQLKAVLSDLNVKAVKIGMVPDAGVAHVIAAALREYKASHDCHVVYDPVMISTSGRRLMAADCLDVVVEELMPLCTLVTPNIPEAEFLAAKTGIVCEGGALADALHASILIKADTPTERCSPTACSIPTAAARASSRKGLTHAICTARDAPCRRQ